jgi:hypothetical protein
MKVKFISSTNQAFEELFGEEVDLSYSMIAHFTFDTSDVSFDFRHGYARTSQIENISIVETSRFCFEITIKTVNSTYVFQEGIPSDKLPFSKKDRLITSLAYGVF